MSCNRENVVWKGRDGKWNVGHFAFYSVDTDKEDWDYEWDVEYDYSEFHWASVGHATEDEAHAAWQGSNPGCSMVHYEPDADTDRYDAMAAKCIAASKASRY